MLIVDTSGLLAFYDPDEPDHAAARQAVDQTGPPYLLSPLVLAEVDHLLRVRHDAEQARTVLADLFGGAFDIPMLTPTDLARALEVDRQYSSLNIGLGDAVLVVLADRHRSLDILTLDERHFRALRPLQGGHFRILPTDL